VTRLLWKAHYYDGKTAERHSCELTLAPAACRVSVNGAVTDWPWGEVSQTQGSHTGEPVRLERGGEAVIIYEEGFLRALSEIAPGFSSRFRAPARAGKNLLIIIFAFLITAAAGAAVYLWAIPRASAIAAEKVPPSVEERLGETYATTLLDAFPECDSAEAGEAVQEMLKRLKAAAPPNPYTFRVYLIENEMVNAMAAPGGHIIVFTGLLEATKSPEELAGVLAHEMQHVLKKHVTKGIFQEMSTGMLMSIVLGDFRGASRAVQTIGNLRYSRISEDEADRLGAELLIKADIDTKGMADFFDRLSREKNFIPVKYLSTHPAPDERAENIKRYASGAPKNPTPLLPGVDWETVKKSCSGSSFIPVQSPPASCDEVPSSLGH
jgi:Zn-dependent protease with chaperone function